ncbi:MAG: MBL fold metallo-hydrolase [Bacillota bacterium]|nr:MBL fold metallo-hydrolase [Bacillota bacterium]
MIIKTFVCGMIRNNCYVLTIDNSNEAVIIDPGAQNSNLEAYLITKQLDVKYILLTHGHGDHTGGINRIKDLYPECKLIASKKEAKFLFNRNFSFGQGGIVADINVYDNDELDLCGIKFKVIETPGHTPGGVCYYVESDKVLFSGDTLFQFSVGRTDFPGGNTADLIHSITKKLFLLPDDTRVLPGHEGETEIGKEKVYNPFVS